MHKFLSYLALFTALSIASIAAYFSVVGLATIFAGAWLGVVLMTGALEFGKIVTAAYLHIFWDRLNVLKWYLTLSVVVLMLITALGIFGYLAKASSDTSYATASSQAEVDRYNTQIERQENKITSLTTRLDTLGGGRFDITDSVTAQEQIRDGAWDRVQGDIDYAQSQINGVRDRLKVDLESLDKIVESYTSQGTTGSIFNSEDNVALGIQERNKQQPQRDKLQEDATAQIAKLQGNIDNYRAQAQETINGANAEIKRLQTLNNSSQDEVIAKTDEINEEIDEIYNVIAVYRDERFVFEQEILGFEREVGPIKYVAEVIYGQDEAVKYLDNAIRAVIFAIIFVFDPLAVLLLITSAGIIIGKKRKPKRPWNILAKKPTVNKVEKIVLRVPKGKKTIGGKRKITLNNK